jgi:hypothetical protein
MYLLRKSCGFTVIEEFLREKQMPLVVENGGVPYHFKEGLTSLA